MDDISRPRPVLVYDRIHINRRNTVLLLPLFVALLLPLAYCLTQLVVPFFALNILMTRVDALQVVASTETRALTMMLLALVFGCSTALLGYFLSTDIVLWVADGRRVDRREEPLLSRTVENLCLGGGLPQPAVYVVESRTPNAFSTGRDPEQASLVVTRGLLRLLDERELRGVLAHELSHIGNGDTDLSNLVAALVATTRLPLATVKAFLDSAIDAGAAASLIGVCGLIAVVLFAVFVVGSTLWSRHGDAMALNVREVMTLAAPLYVFFVAPAAAMFVRKTICHQREFLADADAALLTRDPEGLALALAKVSVVTGSSLNAGVATAHLYFIDPLPRADSWWSNTFPSHPPVDARIALLARMGDGIADRTLSNAAAAGFDYAGQEMLKKMALSPEWSRAQGPESGACVPGARLRLTDSRTVLRKSADQSSPPLADLDANVVVTVLDLEAQSIHVRLVDGTVGYIHLLGGLKPLDDDPDGEQDARADAIAGIHYRPMPASVFGEHTGAKTPSRLRGTQFRLTDQVTPLYAIPDGFGDVIEQLSPGTVVTYHERVGSFAHVATDRAVGYIPCAAGVERLSPK